MAQGEQLIFVGGGLNQEDSVLNFVSGDNTEGRGSFVNGDIRYALNARYGSSISDNEGAVENIPSTLTIANYYVWNGAEWVAGSPPGGTNVAINKYQDSDEGCIYWFVANSNSQDLILKFDKAQRKIYELLKTNLSADPDHFISCTKIGDYIIFTDKLSDRGPRIINTTNIQRLKYSLGNDFNEYHISFAKWAPLPSPLAKTSNTAGTTEFTRNGIYQFSYRYIYHGGFKTTFSPPSWFVTNKVNGSNNTFSVVIPGCILNIDNPGSPFFQSSATFYLFVELIEIVYRESTKDTWKLFKRHTVTSGDNINFIFSNSGPIATIPESDSSQYFDSVPFKSGACESIDNRPMFADNDDELLVVPLEITDVSVYVENYNQPTWNGPSTAFTNVDEPPLGAIINTRQFTFVDGGIYKLALVYQHWTGRTWLAQTTDNWSYLIPSAGSYGFQAFYALGFKIGAGTTPPEEAVGYQIVRSNCLNVDMFIYGTVNDFVYLGVPPVLGSGPEANATPQAVVNILNDYFNSEISSGNEGFNISERLANYYRSETSQGSLGISSRIGINIKNWTQVSKSSSGGTTNPSNNVFYNWRKGDRMKFFGSTTSDPDLSTLFDVEISDYNGSFLFINKPIELFLLPRRGDPAASPFFYEIEVYRPKKFNEGDTVLFYEMGEWYPIVNPTTPSRDFIKRDFTWGGPTAVTQSSFGDHIIYNRMPISNGDVWIVTKNMYYVWQSSGIAGNGVSEKNRYQQMNENKFNAGGVWEKNTGKPYVGYSYLPFKTNKPTQIRFGGKFLQDSVFNSINTFKADAQFIYPEEYGRIRSLVNISNAQVESVGNILLAIGEQETWSIYVNRTTLEDLSGSTQVSISDKVLGSFNTLLGSHGTLNPDSVSKDSGRAIWWNAKRGVWVRYSRDGLTVISSRKMTNWFKDIGDLLIGQYSSSTPPKVVSTYDDYHDEWVTYINHSTLPATYRGYDVYKSMSFSEKLGRWGTVFDYTPDVLASLDNEVYSINGASVYIHEEGTDYNKFYGVKKDTYIQPVANIEFRKMKVWEAIGLIASDGWSFESIDGDWRSNGKTRQNSRIPLTSLDPREDMFWADLKRDLNTANTTNAIVNGSPMRSKALTMMMKLDPAVTWLSVFNWLAVEYNISEKTVKK